MYSNVVENEPYYTSSISSAYNKDGILFVACVINPPGGLMTQYCVIKRIDTITKENTEVAKLYARDSRAFLIREGAPETQNCGKYGNVSISIHEEDIAITLEMRYGEMNMQRWGVLRGKAI